MVKLKISCRRKSQLCVSCQVKTNQCFGLAVIFCGFILHLIGSETINIADIFSGHGFTGKTVTDLDINVVQMYLVNENTYKIARKQSVCNTCNSGQYLVQYLKNCRAISLADVTIDPRCLLKWLVLSGCMHHWSHLHAVIKWSRDGKFHHPVMLESLPLGKYLCIFLQVCWVSHSLARYNPRYVTEKSLTDAKSIAWMRFALNLLLLKEFATAVLQTVAVCTKRCLSSYDQLF